jgi:hypothetical protein
VRIVVVVLGGVGLGKKSDCETIGILEDEDDDEHEDDSSNSEFRFKDY